MTAETPVARRIRRPSWRDPRIGVGILLVAASVALGSWVVGDASRGEAYYAASTALTPGDGLDAGALEVVEVRLGAAGEAYLRAGEDLPDGVVASRVVGAGELVPRAALGRAADVDVRPVGVPVDGPVASSVAAGSRVDLWATTPSSGGLGAASAPAEPVLVAPALVVAEVVTDDALFAVSGEAVVEVLVPADDLPDVLAALAGEAVVTLVPVPGAA